MRPFEARKARVPGMVNFSRRQACLHQIQISLAAPPSKVATYLPSCPSLSCFASQLPLSTFWGHTDTLACALAVLSHTQITCMAIYGHPYHQGLKKSLMAMDMV